MQNLSDEYIRSAINGGCDYLTYNIEPKDIEICVARDTSTEVIKMIRKLADKWDNVEEFGELADLIEEIEEEGWEEYLEGEEK